MGLKMHAICSTSPEDLPGLPNQERRIGRGFLLCLPTVYKLNLGKEYSRLRALPWILSAWETQTTLAAIYSDGYF